MYGDPSYNNFPWKLFILGLILLNISISMETNDSQHISISKEISELRIMAEITER